MQHDLSEALLPYVPILELGAELCAKGVTV